MNLLELYSTPSFHDLYSSRELSTSAVWLTASFFNEGFGQFSQSLTRVFSSLVIEKLTQLSAVNFEVLQGYLDAVDREQNDIDLWAIELSRKVHHVLEVSFEECIQGGSLDYPELSTVSAAIVLAGRRNLLIWNFGDFEIVCVRHGRSPVYAAIKSIPAPSHDKPDFHIILNAISMKGCPESNPIIVPDLSSQDWIAIGNSAFCKRVQEFLGGCESEATAINADKAVSHLSQNCVGKRFIGSVLKCVEL